MLLYTTIHKEQRRGVDRRMTQQAAITCIELTTSRTHCASGTIHPHPLHHSQWGLIEVRWFSRVPKRRLWENKSTNPACYMIYSSTNCFLHNGLFYTVCSVVPLYSYRTAVHRQGQFCLPGGTGQCQEASWFSPLGSDGEVLLAFRRPVTSWNILHCTGWSTTKNIQPQLQQCWSRNIVLKEGVVTIGRHTGWL